MNINIYSLLPLSYAIMAFVMGPFLLSTKKNKIATYSLGAAALLQAVMAFLLFLFCRDLPSGINIIYARTALSLASLNPALIVLFSFHHIRMESPLFPGIKKLAIPAATLMGIVFSLLAFHPSFLQSIERISDDWTLFFGPAGTAFSIYLILCLLIILFQMEETVRNTQGYLRIRLTYLLLGITAGSLYTLFMASILLLYHLIYLDLLVAGTTVYTACWGMIAFAVTRHRLLDVDIFVSRHVVFASVAAFGIGSYLVVMSVLSYLLQIVSGKWGLLLSATFVSATLMLLAMLLFSTTLQKRVKHFIIVHFYRHKYDYRLEWKEFTQKISDAQDLNTLLNHIIEMIIETIWVNQVSIWLYNERSGILSFSRSRNLPRKAGFLNKASPLVQHLLHHGSPFNVKDPNVQNIVTHHQDLFNLFNISVVVPLKKGEHLLGMITLGAEMKRNEFIAEDYELLKTIAQQASGAIFSAQVIDEVAITKEAESFHKISSFLVHDLKNLVSSLSLVLQNAERNISKPDFQKDLLSTLLNTIEKMKRLIENLSTLPKELDIKKARIDINQLVNEALESSKVEQLKSVQVSRDLNDLPSIQGDGEYIKKVFINLVLNAIQSLPGGRGRVELTTYVKDGYAHVEVLDSGAGMTEEFIKKQLFKPFTTTKKKGLGIGLYQCKAIMEAHGGNIEASSIPNRGSQFTLKFPVE